MNIAAVVLSAIGLAGQAALIITARRSIDAFVVSEFVAVLPLLGLHGTALGLGLAVIRRAPRAPTTAILAIGAGILGLVVGVFGFLYAVLRVGSAWN